jgi:hypothetical protein
MQILVIKIQETMKGRRELIDKNVTTEVRIKQMMEGEDLTDAEARVKDAIAKMARVAEIVDEALKDKTKININLHEKIKDFLKDMRTEVVPFANEKLVGYATQLTSDLTIPTWHYFHVNNINLDLFRLLHTFSSWLFDLQGKLGLHPKADDVPEAESAVNEFRLARERISQALLEQFYAHDENHELVVENGRPKLNIGLPELRKVVEGTGDDIISTELQRLLGSDWLEGEMEGMVEAWALALESTKASKLDMYPMAKE